MRIVLRLVFALFIGFFAENAVHAQVLVCKVTAPSGMNLRSKPSTTGRIVGRVIRNDTIVVSAETYGELKLEGIPGNWRKVVEVPGDQYVWDGYLEILAQKGDSKRDSSAIKNEVVIELPDTTIQLQDAKPDTDTITWEMLLGKDYFDSVEKSQNDKTSVERSDNYNDSISKKPFTRPKTSNEVHLLLESYNFCGNAGSINLNLHWIAFLPDERGMRPHPTDVSIELSQNRISTGMEFDITTKLENRSYFLLGFKNKPELEFIFSDVEEVLRLRGRNVLPGERRMISQSGEKHSVYLSALGTFTNFNKDCIDNYQLFAFIDLRGNETRENISKLLPKSADCNMADLYWYGDINNDGVPDMIFVNVEDEENIFTLIMSDLNKDLIYHAVSVFSTGICK
ncbi:MAG: SH3 domain-containing protein [Cryomorphaceae bacterium]|nr:SH3 domain-containing protein [Cryomorphaceae bacterium]